MRRYLFYSLTGHGVLLAFALSMGALLSKPRMSYYAVDLFTSLPAGHPGAVRPAQVVKPLVSAPVGTPEVKKIPLKEAIKVKGKKHVRTHEIKDTQKTRRAGENNAAPAVQGAPGVSGPGGPGVMVETGPAFPYPWYLRALSDRLDHQWHPPQNFQTDTQCQVVFVIQRDGQVAESSLEKSSGDDVFDQLALRAVLYASPMPPLPSGFPDDTLRVHMRFVGKPI